MKISRLLSTAAAVVLLQFAAAHAGEVKIESVHICCGQCVTGAQNALKGVAGVSDAKADQASSTITLTAADDAAAAAAIDALAKAGFRGNAKHGDKTLEFPAANASMGSKADTATITGVHLCCPACYTAAEKALKGVGGVSEVKSNRSNKTIEINGKDVDLHSALQALFKAGFQASVKM